VPLYLAIYLLAILGLCGTALFLARLDTLLARKSYRLERAIQAALPLVVLFTGSALNLALTLLYLTSLQPRGEVYLRLTRWTLPLATLALLFALGFKLAGDGGWGRRAAGRVHMALAGVLLALYLLCLALGV